MSLSKNELLYLMAYADGEVDDDEIPEVEALIASSEEARHIIAQQAALRQWTVEAADTRAVKAGADSIADAVLRKIDDLGGAKVITLERERAKRELNQQRVKEFGALAAIAAAVAVFYFWPSDGGPVATHETPQTPQVTAPAPSVAPPAPEATVPAAVASAEPETPSIDIQAVESPQHQFSIFYVPGATGANAHASSVVVWIGEE